MRALLLKILELLRQLVDSLTAEKEPDRPNKLSNYDIPKIVRLKDINLKTHGEYLTPSGKARGLIVHYTVSGRSSKSARGVLSYLARKGLGCMVMDELGTIYIAGNVTLDKSVAWHAGSSYWKGKSGMSQYCMGMEICNWGRLNDDTRHKSGPIRSGEKQANCAKGDYEKFTWEQEKALQNFILWQKDVNQEFDIDYVIGHDECSKSGKTDPGYSFSMTMPAARTYLKSLVSGS